jgi:hypothetical protein
MCVEIAIEKLQRITREKEVQKSEHRRKQEEEAKVSKQEEVEEELRRGENVGALNIQLLAVRSVLHSPSSLECEKGKQYHENVQFAHSII